MNTTTRRNFLKQTAALAGAASVFPVISPAQIFGANAPSNRVLVAHIGVGGRGAAVMQGFLKVPQGQSIAVCDPFKDRREKAAALVDKACADQRGQGSYRACQAYHDFRELLARADLEAVVIATPDHWHVPLGLAALEAGKDVYIEKPLGVSMEQDKAMRAAIHRHHAVFQYGTQQRSSSQHCGFACELVRNGYLGQLKAIDIIAPNGVTGGNAVAQPVPEGFDYDLWLGPAPVAPYAHDRVIGTGRFHIYDYSLGFIAGWGAHPLDIAHWGYPQIPIEYEATGSLPKDGLFDTVYDWDIRGRYADGVKFTMKPGPNNTTFVGTEGWVAASRGAINAEPDSLLKIKIKPSEIHLLQDTDHARDFLDCVRTRKNPVSNIDSATQSDFISHLGDIAIRTGRKITWDPLKETIVGDETAARMMRRATRAPWTI